MADYEADVVIVGSGVAGSIIASRLAQRGRKVLLLDAGPAVERGAAQERFRASAVKTPESPYPEAAHAPRPSSSDPHHYYVQKGPDLWKNVYLRNVGGTTWHWLGTTNCMRPEDFELRQRHGIGLDWPIRYRDLEPWYRLAERELGVAGTSEDADPNDGERSAPFPLPPLRLTPLDLLVKRAAETAGIRLQTTPQARNSEAFGGRPACCGSANCVPLCPIGAKYDAASVHLASALRSGAQLLSNAVVVSVDLDEQRRVSQVRFLRADGSAAVAAGRVFILAAHGIETPKLLLLSRGERSPQGVANSSGQVGRNLMDHPAVLSWALTATPIYPYRSPQSTAGIEQFRSGVFRSRYAGFRIQVTNTGWLWPVGDPTDIAAALIRQGLQGLTLQKALREQVARQFFFASMAELLPSPDNRIVPDFEQRDALGIPRPQIHYRVDEYTREGLRQAQRVSQQIFDAMGATAIHHGTALEGTNHIMGTVRMGTDPRSSVADSLGRTHDHPNLYVAGSGLFPTAGTCNPTLTIAALALRTADHLLQTEV